MFRLFTTQTLNFDHNIIYIREQMFRHFTSRIKAMFDHDII